MTGDEKRSENRKKRRVVVVKTVGATDGEPELLTSSGEALDEVLSHALSGREHVVMVRVNDATLQKLDMLVESGLCASRSSAAAFVLHEGIESNAALFDAVGQATDQIAKVREDLLQKVMRRETETENT